jgi:hypothetical protein
MSGDEDSDGKKPKGGNLLKIEDFETNRTDKAFNDPNGVITGRKITGKEERKEKSAFPDEMDDDDEQFSFHDRGD